MSAPNRLLLWTPVFLYVALIFWLSSAPRYIPGAEKFPWIDKPLHAIEYFPLGLLTFRAIGRSWSSRSFGRIFLWGFLFTLAVGVSDEFYQRFTPMRTSSMLDSAADLAGASLGQLAGWALLFRRVRG